MGLTVAQIADLIIAKILTGGRRTSGQNVRDVTNAINEAFLNLKGAADLDAATLPIDDADILCVSQGGVLKRVAKSDLVTGGGGGAVDSVNGQTGVVVLDKADIGLPNADNTSDATKQAATLLAIRNGVPSAGDDLQKLYNLIVGMGTFVSGYDASGGALPTTGSGASGAIDKGDYWKITVAGTFSGLGPVKAGDSLWATVANASVAADFFVLESNADQATSSTLGLVKLYTDLLASNTDGGVTQAVLVAALATKQATLVSGTNIKTVNGESLLGSGDIVISGGVFDPSVDEIGDITLANTAIADNDTVTVAMGKAQGQIVALADGGEDVFSVQGATYVARVYVDAININSISFGSTPRISLLRYSTNGGSSFSEFTSFPVAIAAGTEVIYEITYTSLATVLTSFIVRYTKQ
jgi:hypothetical protein